MKKLISLPVLVFIVGFVLGAVFFFPFEQLKYPIQDIVNRTTQGDLQLGNLQMGTGLGLGIVRGGLFAVHAENVQFTLSTGQTFECSQATLSPRLFSLLTLKASIGFRCILPKNAKLSGVVTAGPIWAPKSASIDVSLDRIPLDIVENFAALGTFSGSVNGEVHVRDFDLRGYSTTTKVSWSISGDKITLPPVMNDFIKLPSISLGPVASMGSYNQKHLQVDKLEFGNPKLPMQGQMKIDFGLDASGSPISGELSGNLRTDPVFEQQQLRSAVNLDLFFGTVKNSGKREFRKVVRGSALSLMSPPES